MRVAGSRERLQTGDATGGQAVTGGGVQATNGIQDPNRLLRSLWMQAGLESQPLVAPGPPLVTRRLLHAPCHRTMPNCCRPARSADRPLRDLLGPPASSSPPKLEELSRGRCGDLGIHCSSLSLKPRPPASRHRWLLPIVHRRDVGLWLVGSRDAHRAAFWST